MWFRVCLTCGRLHLFPLVLRTSVSDMHCLLLWVCVCVSVCNIMTGIRSSAQAPELSSQTTVGFQQYLPNSSGCCDCFDTNVYFPADRYDTR